MTYVFAGDRQISVNILKWLVEQGYKPAALLVSEGSTASHADSLIQVSGLAQEFVFKGKEFTTEKGIEVLSGLKPDYIFGIHFPYIIRKEVLTIPRYGFLNLHPAYLPFNKGWHTPSWAILEGTPYGATLHYMSEQLDEGDIIHQKQMDVSPADTANTLYQRVFALEEDVFKEAFPGLKNLAPKRIVQTEKGTAHVKKDLEKRREIDLDKPQTGRELLNQIRALTTNKVSEAAYFTENGKKYLVQVHIEEDSDINGR